MWADGSASGTAIGLAVSQTTITLMLTAHRFGITGSGTTDRAANQNATSARYRRRRRHRHPSIPSGPKRRSPHPTHYTSFLNARAGFSLRPVCARLQDRSAPFTVWASLAVALSTGRAVTATMWPAPAGSGTTVGATRLNVRLDPVYDTGGAVAPDRGGRALLQLRHGHSRASEGARELLYDVTSSTPGVPRH